MGGGGGRDTRQPSRWNPTLAASARSWAERLLSGLMADAVCARSTFERSAAHGRHPDAADRDRVFASLNGLAPCCCKPCADEAGYHSACEPVGGNGFFRGTVRSDGAEFRI